MKKLIIILFLPLFSFALSLTTVLGKVENNDLIQSKQAQKEAQEMQLEMINSSYMPKIEASGMYRYLSDEDQGFFDPMYSMSVTASYVVFDGFRHSDLAKAQNHRINAASVMLDYEKESLSLQATRLFFNIRTQRAVIKVSEQKIKQLKNESERLQKLYDARIVQEDLLESVKAALAMSQYELELHKQNHTKMLYAMRTLTGLDLDKAEAVGFKEPQTVKETTTKAIQAQELEVLALESQADAETSSYLPQVVLQDTLTNTTYYESSFSSSFSIPETINKIEVVAQMTLLDFSAKSESKQKMLLQKKAMQAELSYQKKALVNEQKLSFIGLLTGKEKMRSALLNLTASQKSYEFREKSFKANLIDSTQYLDALTKYTQAQALYEQSKNDYEIAKALYYFNHDITLKEQIK